VERATGHVGFMPFLLLPWLLYFYDRAKSELRFVVPCALTIAYCIFAGAPYPFVMFMLYTALLVAWDAGGAVVKRRAWREALRYVGMGALIALLVALVASVKALAVVDFMSEYPRKVYEWDYLAKWQVWEVFLEPLMTRGRKGYAYVFGEYRNYLGPFVMIAVPLMFMRFRAHARDYFLLAILGVLMLGNFAWWSPYALLQKVPVFGSMRVPVRHALLMDLHIGLLFGAMLARAREVAGELPPRWKQAAVAGLVMLLGAATFDLSTQNNRQLFGFYHVDPSVPPRDGPYRMVRGDSNWLFRGPARNEGQLACYDIPNPIAISPHLKAQPASEAYVGEGQGTARVLSWNPNQFVVSATTTTPAVIALNTNFHRDWHVGDGDAERWRGLVAARVPAGVHELRFWYRPRRLPLYAGVTGLGFLACFVLWRRLGAVTRG
jgi:hypothetical protein